MGEKQSSRFTMKDILELLDLGLEEYQPGKYRGKCPFHQSLNDGSKYSSFNLDVEKGYKCFAGHCNASGGSISFIKAFFNLKNYWEAHKYIYKNFNVKTEIYEQWEEQKIKPYMDYLKHRGLSEETIRHYELSVSLQHKRIKIPIFNHGQSVGAIYRSINDDEPRYFCDNGLKKSHYLFNQDNLAGKEKSALLTEGAFSVFSIFEHLKKESIATLSCNISDRQLELLLELGLPLYVMFDGDSAGRKAGERIENELKDKLETRIIKLDDNVQPDHLARKALKKLLKRYGL